MYLAMGVIAYLVINSLKNGLKNFGASLGIGDSVEDEAREKSITKLVKSKDIKDYFKPSFWKEAADRNKKPILLTKAIALSTAKTIYDSIGFFYDTPEQALGAFKTLKYKSQVSWLAQIFYEKYKKDLYQFLNDRLDKDDQRLVFKEILQVVSDLKRGY
jgi:hypothetical protein